MEFGITHDGFAIDMAGVRERKRKMVRGLNDMYMENYRSTGARVHIGNGPVPGSENMEVTLADGTTRQTAGHDRILGFTAFAVGAGEILAAVQIGDDRRAALYRAARCGPDSPNTGRRSHTSVLIRSVSALGTRDPGRAARPPTYPLIRRILHALPLT